MRVIAKYKSVEVIYPDGAIQVVKCHSVHDAIEFRSRLLKAIPYRERATNDTTYLKDFYDYLKNKGVIETDSYMRQQALIHKAAMVREISLRWA
ncbi:hypothetical protein ACFH4J_003422 [Escherichia coli]